MTTATVLTIDERRHARPVRRRLQTVQLRGSPRAAPRERRRRRDASGTAPTVKVFFGQGEQLVAVQRPGATVQDALAALVAGPTAAEAEAVVPQLRPRRHARAQRDPERRRRDGRPRRRLPRGVRRRHDARAARPGRQHGDRGARRTSMLLLINGGMPLGLFPGVDATVPLDPGGARAAQRARHAAGAPPSGPATTGTRALQQQLADLGYLLAVGGSTARRARGPRPRSSRSRSGRGSRAPASVDDRTARALATAYAPDRHQAGPRRASRRGADRPPARARDRGQPGRPHDPRLDRQALDPDDDRAFHVYGKFARWWSTPFREWLLWASRVHRRHRDAPVPRRTGLRGLARLRAGHAVRRQWLFDFNSVGEPVDVIAKST